LMWGWAQGRAHLLTELGRDLHIRGLREVEVCQGQSGGARGAGFVGGPANAFAAATAKAMTPTALVSADRT
jgi:hypothetical protein